MKKNKLGLIVIFIGIIIVIYPVVANILVSYTQTSVISNYNEMIKKLEKEQIAIELEKAREYNNRLNLDSEIKIHTKNENKDEKTSYLNVLNLGKIIGYIDIPKIGIYLPIYHGTNDDVLQAGVGHVENSSFPIGEKNTHTVLAGHSGLARTKVFDDIDKLDENDMFFLYIFGEMFAYKVDQIKIVLPEETKDVQIEKDKEYVTLLTCTPFVINSHRLLVRGERVEGYVRNAEIKEESNKLIQDNSQNIEIKNYKNNNIVIIILIVLLVVIFVVWKNRNGKKRRKPRISKI